MSDNQVASFKKKFFADSGYIFASSLFVNFIFTINSIIVARYLGPEKLGVLSIIQYLGGMFIIFASFNVPSAVIKFVAEYRAIGDDDGVGKIIGNVSALLLTTTFFVFGSVFIFSDSIAGFYKDPSISLLLKTYSLIIFFSVLHTLNLSILAGLQKMQLISKLNAGLALIGIPITLILIFYFNVFGAVFALIINAGLSGLISSKLVINNLKNENINTIFSIDKNLIKKILKYATPLFISGIAYTLFQLFGPSVLLLKENFADVGYYKVAIAINTMILFIPNAINYNLVPTVSNLSASKNNQLLSFITKILKAIMFIVLPMIILAGFLSEKLILLLFGDAYLGAVSVTYVLIISVFFVSISATIGAVFRGIGKTRILMNIDIFIYLMYMVFSYVLISQYGLIGLAISYLLTYLFATLVCLFYVSKHIGVRIKEIAFPFFICITFIIINYFITQLLSGIILFVTGFSTLVILLFIEWRLIDKSDKDMIIKMFDKRVKKYLDGHPRA